MVHYLLYISCSTLDLTRNLYNHLRDHLVALCEEVRCNIHKTDPTFLSITISYILTQGH
jgi:hypothetical protein